MLVTSNRYSFPVYSLLYCLLAGMPYSISRWFSFASLQASNLASINHQILDLLENSLKHAPYSTFLDTISHSDLINSVFLPKQQPSLYNKFCFFAQATAITISALLFLARWSLLANILYPSKRNCTVSRCTLHNLLWLFLVNPLSSKFWFQSSVLSLT